LLVAKTMSRWNTDLGGVREPLALEKLPEDGRKAWQALWADVDALPK
jgi:hypothetical protein